MDYETFYEGGCAMQRPASGLLIIVTGLKGLTAEAWMI